MDETKPRRGVHRLVVELNPRVAHQLDDLVLAEGLNKTTLVNRAIQVYALVVDVQTAGGRLYVQEADSDQLQRLTII